MRRSAILATLLGALLSPACHHGASAPPAPAVALSIDTDPPRLEVAIAAGGTTRVVRAPATVRLPRGGAASLTVTSSGFVPYTATVPLDHDRAVILRPRTPGAASPPASRATRRTDDDE